MSSILYYITGHGYGHAVRSSQVIGSLKKTSPDLQIHVRTMAPEWLFLDRAFQSRQAIDVGILQKDSLDMDLEERCEPASHYMTAYRASLSKKLILLKYIRFA